MKPTIAVIGGTGKAGQYLVKQLLLQGFSLRLLLRDPEKFPTPHPFVEVIKGDARDYASIISVVDGCQAIMSTLGQPQGEPPIFSSASANVLRALNETSLKRYIVVTGLSIDTPFDRKGDRSSQASEYMRRLFPAIIADKQKEYETLSLSQTDWTLVRVPLIEQTDARGTLKVNMEDCPGEKISATDLADFFIEQLSGQQYLRKAPFISTC